MDISEIHRVLTTLIEYFEAGNRESDAAAKAFFAADGDEAYWMAELDRFKRSGEWTGLRGPEAELLAVCLRRAAELIGVEEDQSKKPSPAK